jgi:hypothetical protein
LKFIPGKVVTGLTNMVVLGTNTFSIAFAYFSNHKASVSGLYCLVTATQTMDFHYKMELLFFALSDNTV